MNREHRAFDDTYWRERNDAAFRDASILRHADALRSGIDALKALDGIEALHDSAVAAHRTRRDALLTQDTYREMRRQLLSASPYPPVEAALMAELGLK